MLGSSLIIFRRIVFEQPPENRSSLLGKYPEPLESPFQTTWVNGFLSAFNYYGTSESADIAKGIDANGVYAWIDNYCAAHPLDTIATATIALVTELSKRRGQ